MTNSLEELRKIANGEILDEVFQPIAVGKKPKMESMLVFYCNRIEEGGRAGKAAHHACRIKFRLAHKENYTLPVPTGVFTEAEVAKFQADIRKCTHNSTLEDQLKTFVFENQMAIIALWYADDKENEKLGIDTTQLIKYLKDYLDSARATLTVTKNSTKPANAAALSKQQQEVCEYVTERLDPEGKNEGTPYRIYFGAKRRKP